MKDILFAGAPILTILMTAPLAASLLWQIRIERRGRRAAERQAAEWESIYREFKDASDRERNAKDDLITQLRREAGSLESLASDLRELADERAKAIAIYKTAFRS